MHSAPMVVRVLPGRKLHLQTQNAIQSLHSVAAISRWSTVNVRAVSPICGSVRAGNPMELVLTLQGLA